MPAEKPNNEELERRINDAADFLREKYVKEHGLEEDVERLRRIRQGILNGAKPYDEETKDEEDLSNLGSELFGLDDEGTETTNKEGGDEETDLSKLGSELVGLDEEETANGKPRILSGVEAIKKGWDDTGSKIACGDAPHVAAYNHGLSIRNYTMEDVKAFGSGFNEACATDPRTPFFPYFIMGLIENIASQGDAYTLDLTPLRIPFHIKPVSVKAKATVRVVSFDSIGNYNLVEKIGAGDLCDVYRAKDAGSKEVAVKVLRPKWEKEQMAEGFQRVAEKLKALRSKNTARYLDFGRDEKGGPYLAMEFFGDPYISLDNAELPLPLEETVNIMHQLASALVYAHKKGIYHGCIKPGDVFYDAKTGTVKLADFGLARILFHALAEESTISGDDFSVSFDGPYFPPEISPSEGPDKSYDPAKADVNSMGRLYYKLLTGDSPPNVSLFSGRLNSLRLEVIKRKHPDVPFGLFSLVGAMGDGNPDTRPSPADVARRLRQIYKQIK